jgi:hypothetical protein
VLLAAGDGEQGVEQGGVDEGAGVVVRPDAGPYGQGGGKVMQRQVHPGRGH